MWGKPGLRPRGTWNERLLGMGQQQPMQARALRQAREQGGAIAAQPTIEGAEVPPERKQQANLHQCARTDTSGRSGSKGA